MQCFDNIAIFIVIKIPYPAKYYNVNRENIKPYSLTIVQYRDVKLPFPDIVIHIVTLMMDLTCQIRFYSVYRGAVIK